MSYDEPDEVAPLQNDEAGREPEEKVEKPPNDIPIVDPTKSESRGAAPQPYFEHFLWSLKGDTMILIYKFMFMLVIGMTLYWIATIHIYVFFALSVVLPSIILIIYQFFYRKLFIDTFEATILIKIKYCTFISQNAALCFAYWFCNDNNRDAVMSEILTWVLRINILEVAIATKIQRLYVYWIPSLVLLLPLCGWSEALDNFPRLNVVGHEHYVVVWEGWDAWFIIIYTGWFLGWIIHTTNNMLPYVMHTLFPLFAPPALWFSVRTFTGMFLLYWLYFTPAQKYIKSPESAPQAADFSEIYDALYVMVFCGAFVMPFLMEHIEY